MTKLFILLFHSALSLASPGHELIGIEIEEKAKVLNSWQFKKIADHDLDSVWHFIDEKLGKETPGYYKDLLRLTWDTLKAKGHIVELTSDLRLALGLPYRHCSQPNKCYKLDAFYLPVSNFILLNYEKLTEEVAYLFYHELVHAMQYSFRLPLDLALVNSFTRDAGLKRGEVLDFLSYYYEVQAHWYTLRLAKPQIWLDQSTSTLMLNATNVPKSLVALFGLTLPAFIGDKFLEGEFPKIDYKNREHTLKGEHFGMYELAIDIRGHALNPSVNLDIDFLRRFARLVQKAYLGSEKTFTRNDQALFVKLHDQFLDAVLKPERQSVEDVSACYQSIIDNIFSQESSLSAWFKVPLDKMQNCPTYLPSEFWRTRSDLIKLYTEPSAGSFYHGGGRGAGGPMLQIQPQLSFTPEMMD